mgnify:CR=1 FL=1
MLALKLKRQWYQRRCDQQVMQHFLAAALPRRSTGFLESSFLVVDLETTGLNAAEGEIASIGWVLIEKGAVQLSSAQHHLIQVKQGVGQSAVFHQIHDQQLESAQSIQAAMAAFLAAATGRLLVFHHAELDKAFLSQACRKLYGVPLIAPVVDTLQLEKKKLINTLGHIDSGALRLFSCRQRYGLPDYAAHDALVDAIATAELLLALVSHRGGKVSLAELI